jgi:hypothetical protein
MRGSRRCVSLSEGELVAEGTRMPQHAAQLDAATLPGPSRTCQPEATDRATETKLGRSGVEPEMFVR